MVGKRSPVMKQMLPSISNKLSLCLPLSDDDKRVSRLGVGFSTNVKSWWSSTGEGVSWDSSTSIWIERTKIANGILSDIFNFGKNMHDAKSQFTHQMIDLLGKNFPLWFSTIRIRFTSFVRSILFCYRPFVASFSGRRSSSMHIRSWPILRVTVLFRP